MTPVGIDTLVFAVAAVGGLAAAIAMVLARNAVHSALFLVLVQLTIAIHFLLQGAFFIAVLQVIVYAGAIMVLFLFVVMLLGVDRKESLIESLRGQRPLAAGLSLLLIAEIVFLTGAGRVRFSVASAPVGRPEGSNVEEIATALFTRWAFPFELASVILVIAVIAPIVLARRRVGLKPADGLADLSAPDSDEKQAGGTPIEEAG